MIDLSFISPEALIASLNEITDAINEHLDNGETGPDRTGPEADAIAQALLDELTPMVSEWHNRKL